MALRLAAKLIVNYIRDRAQLLSFVLRNIDAGPIGDGRIVRIYLDARGKNLIEPLETILVRISAAREKISRLVPILRPVTGQKSVMILFVGLEFALFRHVLAAEQTVYPLRFQAAFHLNQIELQVRVLGHLIMRLLADDHGNAVGFLLAFQA